MLHRVRHPTAFAAAIRGSRVVAVGRAVASDGWTGVCGMATLPEARGIGAARAVLGSLARWASAEGIAQMYLQVSGDNGAGLRLYELAGFTELCRYHYRTRG